MTRYRLTLWITEADSAGALVVDLLATSPGRAVDQALDKYRLPFSAVIGLEQVTKRESVKK